MGYGTNSSAPMSQVVPVGRRSPSKSVVGAPVQVPASMQGERALRWMSPKTNTGSLMLPPRSVTGPAGRVKKQSCECRFLGNVIRPRAMNEAKGQPKARRGTLGL